MQEKVHRVWSDSNVRACDWDLLRVTQYDLYGATAEITGPRREKCEAKMRGSHFILMPLTATLTAALDGKVRWLMMTFIWCDEIIIRIEWTTNTTECRGENRIRDDDVRWSMRWNIIRIVIQYSMIYAEMRRQIWLEKNDYNKGLDHEAANE